MKKTDLFAINEHLLSRDIVVKIRAVGESMWPFLRAEDCIHVQQKNKYIIGDIVVVRYTDRYLLHRIISISETSLRIKGDNVRFIDSCNDQSQILGKAIKFERNTKVVDLETSRERKKGKLIAYASPILPYINYPIIRIWNRVQTRRK